MLEGERCFDAPRGRRGRGRTLSPKHVLFVSLARSVCGLLRGRPLSGTTDSVTSKKYSYFKWPAWVSYALSGNSPFQRQAVPPFLSNNTIRDSLLFTNLLSHEELKVDPAGMVCPTFASWSVEIWVKTSGQIFRSSESIDRVAVQRNPKTDEIKILWKEKEFTVEQNIYGTRSTVDEAIVDVECRLVVKFVF